MCNLFGKQLVCVPKFRQNIWNNEHGHGDLVLTPNWRFIAIQYYFCRCCFKRTDLFPKCIGKSHRIATAFGIRYESTTKLLYVSLLTSEITECNTLTINGFQDSRNATAKNILGVIPKINTN